MAGNGVSYQFVATNAIADKIQGRLVSFGKGYGITSSVHIRFGRSEIYMTSITGDFRRLLPSLQGQCLKIEYLPIY